MCVCLCVCVCVCVCVEEGQGGLWITKSLLVTHEVSKRQRAREGGGREGVTCRQEG